LVSANQLQWSGNSFLKFSQIASHTSFSNLGLFGQLCAPATGDVFAAFAAGACGGSFSPAAASAFFAFAFSFRSRLSLDDEGLSSSSP